MYFFFLWLLMQLSFPLVLRLDFVSIFAFTFQYLLFVGLHLLHSNSISSLIALAKSHSVQFFL
jgi:hypothetical protein